VTKRNLLSLYYLLAAGTGRRLSPLSIILNPLRRVAQLVRLPVILGQLEQRRVPVLLLQFLNSRLLPARVEGFIRCSQMLRQHVLDCLFGSLLRFLTFEVLYLYLDLCRFAFGVVHGFSIYA
jgi:hypothetical protein